MYLMIDPPLRGASAYFATLVGGAKKHGEVNQTLDGPSLYSVVDKSNPIMKDMSDLTISDEAFFTITWTKDPSVHVLATTRAKSYQM
jgi:hypothetical protein